MKKKIIGTKIINPVTIQEVKKILEEIKRHERERLAKRRAEGKCCAVLYHGPGHQSETFCQRMGKHKVHGCTYGNYDQYAEWNGMKKFTGYFDEAP